MPVATPEHAHPAMHGHDPLPRSAEDSRPPLQCRLCLRTLPSAAFDRCRVRRGRFGSAADDRMTCEDCYDRQLSLGKSRAAARKHLPAAVADAVVAELDYAEALTQCLIVAKDRLVPELLYTLAQCEVSGNIRERAKILELLTRCVERAPDLALLDSRIAEIVTEWQAAEHERTGGQICRP